MKIGIVLFQFTVKPISSFYFHLIFYMISIIMVVHLCKVKDNNATIVIQMTISWLLFHKFSPYFSFTLKNFNITLK